MDLRDSMANNELFTEGIDLRIGQFCSIIGGPRSSSSSSQGDAELPATSYPFCVNIETNGLGAAGSHGNSDTPVGGL